MTINANIGLAPWDVFHQGLSKTFGITIGQASIGIGIIIIIINSLFKEKVGWGSLSNMLFIGVFVDILMLNHIIPEFENLVLRALMMFSGMFVIGVATYLYISVGLGAGPRDGLMVALTKRTGKSVRLVRNTIETVVVIIGYFLGGTVGVGTLVIALTIGVFVQLAFQLFKFDVKKVEHRFIDEDIKLLKKMLTQPKRDVGAGGK
ncbi:MAG TPA: hypothetical protein PLE53_00305 [Bacillota bacterium]|nr:hypothetical protein [Bacillota bacterium]HQA47995.1 hypothetical protein [Bacillota bacterium]HQD41037.1 hypothetical protein [Bacillota bacterium]